MQESRYDIFACPCVNVQVRVDQGSVEQHDQKVEKALHLPQPRNVTITIVGILGHIMSLLIY